MNMTESRMKETPDTFHPPPSHLPTFPPSHLLQNTSIPPYTIQTGIWSPGASTVFSLFGLTPPTVTYAQGSTGLTLKTYFSWQRGVVRRPSSSSSSSPPDLSTLTQRNMSTGYVDVLQRRPLLRYSLYTVQCIHCILYTAYCTLHTVCPLRNVHSTL